MNTRKPTHEPVDASVWDAQERVWRAVREGRAADGEDVADVALFTALADLPRPTPDADFAADVAALAARQQARHAQVRRFRRRVLGGLALGYGVALGIGVGLSGFGAWAPLSRLFQHGWVLTAAVCVAAFAVFDRLARHTLGRPHA
ncbi:hypothetical protein [Oleiagrimonas soli]|uniref:Transmembrane protein n=1 Tax=Oleiagrimonas soli TaxID=1543381 RepID=A0A099CTI5_9GAMM|nr:hypothetical protein [Oleiagrimonas soli]KGI76932.1 hypothetical protein LF63_0113535 [Oleiagrimonas soli]MBB6185199.1 hypothetical protein [Oleiagrimonas soli]